MAWGACPPSSEGVTAVAPAVPRMTSCVVIVGCGGESSSAGEAVVSKASRGQHSPGSVLGLACITAWGLFGVDRIEHLISVLWERRGRPMTGILQAGTVSVHA